MNDPRGAPEPSASTNSTGEILRARARALSRVPGAAPDAGASVRVLEFRLAHERYGVEQAYVREVYPLKDLTPVPCTPAFVIGIVNVRGRVLPVIDIKKFFDLPETGITDLHTVVIVQADNTDLGILADSIGGVISISLSDIQNSLPTLTGIRADYLKGITGDQLVILDVGKLLSDPRMTVNEEVQA